MNTSKKGFNRKELSRNLGLRHQNRLKLKQELNHQIDRIIFLIVSLVFLTTSYALSSPGKILKLSTCNKDILIECEYGFIKLSPVNDNILRVHYSKTGNFPIDNLHEANNGPYYIVNYKWDYEPLVVSEKNNYYEISSKSKNGFLIYIFRNPFRIEVYNQSKQLLVRQNHDCLKYDSAGVTEKLEIQKDEHFIGFGGENIL